MIYWWHSSYLVFWVDFLFLSAAVEYLLCCAKAVQLRAAAGCSGVCVWCVQILPGWWHPFVQAGEELSAVCEQPQADSSPVTVGMRSLLFLVTTGLNPSVNWEQWETAKVYSSTLFKIGLHLKVYFAASQNEWMCGILFLRDVFQSEISDDLMETLLALW